MLNPPPDIRSYKVRRRLTRGQAAALERLGPQHLLMLDAVSGVRGPLAVEVGSGMGEATAAWAALEPSREVLAVEVHTPGVANLLRLIESRGLDNVRVVEADARAVLRALPAGGVDEVRVLFPDPWPKRRHVKRRLVTASFLAAVADTLAPGGRLLLSTDDEHYLAGVLTALPVGGLRLASRERTDRPTTRFEARAESEGRACHHLVAVRGGALRW